MSFPPPPPPAGYGYGPGRPIVLSKAQERAQKHAASAQARSVRLQSRSAQRDFRLQRRAFQRSVVGPLLMLVLGVLLLLVETGGLDWTRLLAWYSRWWPGILIATGALLLLEWAIDQRRDTPFLAGPRVLGPGVGAVLLLLALAGWSLGWFHAADMPRNAYGLADQFGLHRLLSHEYEWDDSTQTTLLANSSVTVHNPRGSVFVNGSSTDGQVHVAMHKRAYAWQEDTAETLRRQITPHFSQADAGLLVDVPTIAGAESDITVELPRSAAVTIRSDQGDTSISGVKAAITIISRGGDITLDDIHGNVTLHVNGDASSVSGRKIDGALRLQGRTGDLSFADVAGTLTFEGDFFGSTHLQNIGGPVLFQTSRTRFAAARLPGNLDLDGGPEFHAEDIAGPMVLTTRNRNVSLDRVTGSVQVSNRNGSVSLGLSAPLGPVQVSNARGSVDISLPERTGFRLTAETSNGDLENDFGLPAQQGNGQASISGTIAGGGPEVHVSTSNGGITIRKTAGLDAPVPNSPPEPPPAPPVPARHLRGRPAALDRM